MTTNPAKSKSAFVGTWRIVEMEMWDQDYVDLVVPGHFTFERQRHGSFQFGAVEGWLDCRIERVNEQERVEFSWEGHSENDPVCGRGWAEIRKGELHGRLYIHAGDDSSFRAVRAK